MADSNRQVVLYDGVPGADFSLYRQPSSNAAPIVINRLTGIAYYYDKSAQAFVAFGGSGSGGHTIADEGTPLTARTTLNFVGAGVTATDSGTQTVVTIPGGGTGPTGATGPAGPGIYLPSEDGIDGEPGPPGTAGPQGAAGAQGPVGPAVFLEAEPGEDGAMGPPGQPGIAGVAGATGAVGAAGPQGPAGFGMDGEDGQDGISIPGIPGPQGLQGATGSAGATGAPGATGPAVFLVAEDGEEGQAGPPGQQGIQGLAGSTGSGSSVTIPGLDGEPGDEGPQGPPGSPGAAGATGAAGPAGPAVYLEAEVSDPDPFLVPGPQGPVGTTTAGLLGVAAGLTALTTIAATTTATTGGITLASQTAAAGSVWRIQAIGTFVAASSATARNALITPVWGATALTALTVGAVLASTAQTTSFQCEILLTASSTTAIWSTGICTNRVASATAMVLSAITPASVTVSAGAQTVDLRFSMSAVVAGDSWSIQQVTIERIK